MQLLRYRLDYDQMAKSSSSIWGRGGQGNDELIIYDQFIFGSSNPMELPEKDSPTETGDNTEYAKPIKTIHLDTPFRISNASDRFQ
jgi:hypothetical protein